MKYLWLLPTVRFEKIDKDIYLTHGEKILTIPKIGPQVKDFLTLLDGNFNQKTLEQHPLAPVIIPLLKKYDFIVELQKPIKETSRNYPEYTRQLSYYSHLCKNGPDQVIFDLQEKTVAVIGLGGIGSLLAHNLAGAGVGSLILVDFDNIDRSNFNRQMLYPADSVGKSKTETLKEILVKKFSKLRVSTISANVDERNPNLQKCDLVALCGECIGFYQSPHYLRGQTVIRAGYHGSVGRIGPIFVDKIGFSFEDKLNEHLSRTASRTQYSDKGNSTSWNASGSTINTTIAGLLGEECLRYLSQERLGKCKTYNRECHFNMENFKISYMNC